MTMTPEERRLLHQKGQNPTYGTGVPEDGFGLDGDLSFRKVGKQTIQYLKQDGVWVEVSVSDVDISGITAAQFGDQFIGSVSDFLHWLSKFRSTIRDWGRSWSTTGKFDVDFSSSDDTIINYFQFNTGTDESNTQGNRLFIVPQSCILKNINFFFTTPSDTVSCTYGFRLKFWRAGIDDGDITPSGMEYLEFPGQNNGNGIHDFSVVVPATGTYGIVNIFLGAALNSSDIYSIGVEQINFPDGNNVAKGAIWTAYFSNA